MEVSIAAIIITFNRLEFLKLVVNSLKNQTRRLNAIIIINNSSSDGTSEWLSKQSDIFVINQSNIGSSGGQYTGIEYAFKSNYDWIWVMDDDVVPALNCLETLIDGIQPDIIVAPLRLNSDGTIFFNEAISYNLTNPFKSFWKEIISEKHLNDRLIPADGITFEGPIFNRSVVEKIGFPEKNFFIYGDDTEFFIRARKAGYRIFINTKAYLNRLLSYSAPEKKFSWKNYYVIRNLIAIDVLHGNYFVRIIRPFRYLLAWTLRSGSFKDFKTVLKAFKDGYFFKSFNKYKKN